MMDMIRALEQELLQVLQVLIDNVPSERRVEAPATTLLNGRRSIRKASRMWFRIRHRWMIGWPVWGSESLVS
ncbi:hypothetical protein CF68_32420 [Cupriavidus sp. SK-4]|nr:hypothetical protein CF68_32420 [Cupriavidus sp. SK-4]